MCLEQSSHRNLQPASGETEQGKRRRSEWKRVPTEAAGDGHNPASSTFHGWSGCSLPNAEDHHALPQTGLHLKPFELPQPSTPIIASTDLKLAIWPILASNSQLSSCLSHKSVGITESSSYLFSKVVSYGKPID